YCGASNALATASAFQPDTPVAPATVESWSVSRLTVRASRDLIASQYCRSSASSSWSVMVWERVGVMVVIRPPPHRTSLAQPGPQPRHSPPPGVSGLSQQPCRAFHDADPV